MGAGASTQQRRATIAHGRRYEIGTDPDLGGDTLGATLHKPEQEANPNTVPPTLADPFQGPDYTSSCTAKTPAQITKGSDLRCIPNSAEPVGQRRSILRSEGSMSALQPLSSFLVRSSSGLLRRSSRIKSNEMRSPGRTSRNEFETLQEEVHKKRTVGMTYIEIFDQLAADAGARDNKLVGKAKPRRRATREDRPPHILLPPPKPLRGFPPEASHEMVGRGSDAVTRRDGALGATSTTTHDESMAISRDIAGLEKDSPREAKRRFSREDANEEYRRAEENASETDTTASRPVANLSQQMSGGSRQEEKWPIPIGSGLSTHSGQQRASLEEPRVPLRRPSQSFHNSWRDQDVSARERPDHRLSDLLDPFGDDEHDPSTYQRKTVPGSSVNRLLRRPQIFDKGVDASRMQDLLNDQVEGTAGVHAGGLGMMGSEGEQYLMGEEATDIVIGALKQFFFLDTDGEEEQDRGGGEQTGGLSTGITTLMKAMKHEEFEAGVLLMEQGDEGHHMFVVQEGRLEVIIDDEAVRVIGSGDRVGELALLWNAPRSASVRTLTHCVLWSIHREVFKAVQALTASASLITRSTHLYHIPWLRLIGTKDLSKLAASFRTAQYRDGDVILRQGEATDRCFLVESGEVICSCQDENKEPRKDGTEISMDTCEKIERLMMVSRLAKRAASNPLAKHPVSAKGPCGARPATARNSLGWQEANSANSIGERGPGSRQSRPLLSRQQARLNLEGLNGMGAMLPECHSHWDPTRGEVRFGKGCFLGVPVLLASAELEMDGLPGWDLLRCRESPPGDDTATVSPFAAVSPVALTARGDVKVGHFDVARFTKTVGPFAKVLGFADDADGVLPLRSISGRRSQSRNSLISPPGAGLALMYEQLSVQCFEREAFLGQGSFGHVTMVRKKDKAMEGGHFALKSLSKRAIVEGGQVQHIKDEKKILELFDHPFILRLYATFQDANRVYFLTELLQGGELWSIIYEAASGFDSGLPPEHVKFHGAVVAEALGYMHKKGIAYRDLKPENLIVDEVGYLRVIDMGFAKQIPFFVTVDGEARMHPVSHTMCGTPEYLSPEFIFNKGHDQSVDLWALGVLIFELVEARTPFAPPGAEQDIAQLFTNIACVRKRGVAFPEGFDDRAGGSECRDMISGLLAFEPCDRLGNLADGMDELKRHPLFLGLNWESLASKTLPAPWIPKAGQSPRLEPECIPGANEVYNGDQEYFEDF